jgi:hypothetical protein
MALRFLFTVAAALAASCWLSVGTALAENRIALVIGNSNYNTVTALPNPANDARAMTKFLTSAGFQVVQEPDLTQSDMRRAISDFASKVAAKGPDTVAVVFYAGHGLQVDGENYLIPIDARIEREADVPLQAMRLGDVMNALSGIPSKSRIVILDACRNNPFSTINKTGGRGLAIVDAPNGSLVSYSTAPGTEALDGDGQNSPYTTALLKYGAEPGAPIEQVLKRVRLSVSETTGRQQFPWESSSLISEFSFFPTASGEAQPTLAKGGQEQPVLAKGGHERPTLAKAGPAGTVQASGSDARSVEQWRKELRGKSPRDAYETVVREDRVEAYQAYLALYPNQSMAPVVRTVLERRQVVIAWYQAVTINTPAAYQAFLASYGSSDYAVTANRLLQRSLTRAAANAGAAFAATCPCNVPATPVVPRQKRSDRTPASPSPAIPSPNQNSPANPTGPAPTNVTGYSPPPAVYTDPAPPPVVVAPPVYIPPPRPPIVLVPPYPPRGCGGGKPYPPPGDGKPTPPPPGGGTKPPTEGGTKPPTEGGTKPPIGRDKLQKATGGSISNPSIARRTVESPRVHINKNYTPNTVRSSPGIAKAAMPLRQPSFGPSGGMRNSPMGAMGMGRMLGGGGIAKMMGGGGGGMGRMMGGGGGGMPRMGGMGGGGFGGFRR